MKKTLILSLMTFFLSTSIFADNTLPPSEVARLNKTINIIKEQYIKPESEKTLMDNALTGMVKQLDPHSDFLTNDNAKDVETTVTGKFVGIGVELTAERGVLRVVSPIDGTPAAKSGLKPGDYIVKINNNIIEDMSINDAISQIKGKANTPVILTVIRKNSPNPVIMKIQREEIKIQTVQSKMLSPGYAYIRLSFFQGPVGQQVRTAITKLLAGNGGHLKGLVLDLRNNPGGLFDASADVLNLFLNQKETERYKHVLVSTRGRAPDADVAYYAHDSDMIQHVPMVVLINEGSASAAEITAGALQDYKRAIIMGTRSFGKGSVQTVIPIDANSVLKLTTALYYTPAGREIQARGIEPDVLIPNLTVDDKQKDDTLNFDEMSYQNHLTNHSELPDVPQQTPVVQKALMTDRQQSILELAESDYQLYEALLLLKGMHAMR